MDDGILCGCYFSGFFTFIWKVKADRKAGDKDFWYVRCTLYQVNYGGDALMLFTVIYWL